jgi:hypothetical protein
MAAGYQNLFIEKGATFDITVTLDDAYGEAYDLTNSTAKSQIRKSHYSANATAEFTTSIDTTTGTISLGLSSQVTANIAPGRYVYDTFISFEGAPGQANSVIKILEGVVDVIPNTTRF